MQILWIMVQLSKDLMDWMSRRLCYAVGDTDRPVSWTSVYSLIRRTCPGEDGVCTHVNRHRVQINAHAYIKDFLSSNVMDLDLN